MKLLSDGCLLTNRPCVSNFAIFFYFQVVTFIIAAQAQAQAQRGISAQRLCVAAKISLSAASRGDQMRIVPVCGAGHPHPPRGTGLLREQG